MGQSHIFEPASHFARKLIDEHDYLLDVEKRRDLEAIYQWATREAS